MSVLVGELAHRHEVREHLGRMRLVGEAVIDRHASMDRKLLRGFLGEAAIFDRIIEAPKYPGRILHGFLVADMAAGRADISYMRALVVGGNLEAGAGTGRILLENKGYSFARAAALHSRPALLP
jgi:hypothetical protein